MEKFVQNGKSCAGIEGSSLKIKVRKKFLPHIIDVTLNRIWLVKYYIARSFGKGGGLKENNTLPHLDFEEDIDDFKQNF